MPETHFQNSKGNPVDSLFTILIPVFLVCLVICCVMFVRIIQFRVFVYVLLFFTYDSKSIAGIPSTTGACALSSYCTLVCVPKIQGGLIFGDFTNQSQNHLHKSVVPLVFTPHLTRSPPEFTDLAVPSYQRRPSSQRNREGNVRFPTNLHGVGRSGRSTSR